MAVQVLTKLNDFSHDSNYTNYCMAINCTILQWFKYQSSGTATLQLGIARRCQNLKLNFFPRFQPEQRNLCLFWLKNDGPRQAKKLQ